MARNGWQAVRKAERDQRTIDQIVENTLVIENNVVDLAYLQETLHVQFDSDVDDRKMNDVVRVGLHYASIGIYRKNISGADFAKLDKKGVFKEPTRRYSYCGWKLHAMLCYQTFLTSFYYNFDTYNHRSSLSRDKKTDGDGGAYGESKLIEASEFFDDCTVFFEQGNGIELEVDVNRMLSFCRIKLPATVFWMDAGLFAMRFIESIVENFKIQPNILASSVVDNVARTVGKCHDDCWSVLIPYTYSDGRVEWEKHDGAKMSVFSRRSFNASALEPYLPAWCFSNRRFENVERYSMRKLLDHIDSLPEGDANKVALCIGTTNFEEG